MQNITSSLDLTSIPARHASPTSEKVGSVLGDARRRARKIRVKCDMPPVCAHHIGLIVHNKPVCDT